MKKIILSVVVLAMGMNTVSAQEKRQVRKEIKMTKIDNKQKVVGLLKSIETGDSKPISYINPKKYIQHNLSAADGLAGFGELLAQLPKGSAKANTIRVFEDGLIVEHWDNLQETPKKPNPSGRTMIDGALEVKDIEKT